MNYPTEIFLLIMKLCYQNIISVIVTYVKIHYHLQQLCMVYYIFYYGDIFHHSCSYSSSSMYIPFFIGAFTGNLICKS